MGLFNIYSNQAIELTQKQVFLEYGNLFIEGETVEKAMKLDTDKWIFTNYRLFLVQVCKGDKYEYLTIPYSAIRKFSMTKKTLAEHEAELNIYLQNEEKPLKKTIKKVEAAEDIYKILAKYLINVKSLTRDIPLIKFN